MSLKNLRNIAIIAHVDHGKTTLVDKLLRQSQTLDSRENLGERIMDSNDLERERGITILAKNTAIRWLDKRDGTEYRINIVDTPGHADFGGEVERVLSMVDSVCLLVDAADGPFQMQVISLAYSNYVGVIGTGRISRGRIKPNSPVSVVGRDGKVRQGKVLQVLAFMGLDKVEATEAEAGDIIAITGIEELGISETVCDAKVPEGLPTLQVDEPTMTMVFEVNKSPFAGKEGKFVTSRQIFERLQKELKTNVALRVEPGESPDQFRVSGRGLLHLSVLLENMRREGFEIAVARPQVITKEVDGEIHEPYEILVADVEETHQGGVIQGLSERGGKMVNMVPDGKGRVRLEYTISSRGLIGFRSEFINNTGGSGLLFHNFDHFGPAGDNKDVGQRYNGVLISNEQGKAVAYALFNLQERGAMIASHGDDVYEGQIVGVHSRENDLVVNVWKGKKLTNMRASGSDENVVLTPPRRFSLEQALEFINDDELVELTPESIRLRKRYLVEHERKRAGRSD